MFENVSMTGSGLAVMALGALLGHFGVQIGNDQITALVDGVIQVGGIVLTIVGQLRRSDLHFGLLRKSDS